MNAHVKEKITPADAPAEVILFIPVFGYEKYLRLYQSALSTKSPLPSGCANASLKVL